MSTNTTPATPKALRLAALADGWQNGHAAAADWAATGQQPGNLFEEFIADSAASNWFGRRGRADAWLTGYWTGVRDYYFPPR